MSKSPSPTPSFARRPSPYKQLASRDRSSSRSSLRAHSPSVSLDDPVAVRGQMSVLKHSIRQQQAQLTSLENIIRAGPRPYHSDFTDSELFNPAMTVNDSNISTPPSAFSAPTPSAVKIARRSSYDILQGIAGPESSLPLPRRDAQGLEENGIKEGIPMSFNVNAVSPVFKRASSPTRTLSRIPISSVGNARALADEGHSPPQRLSPSSQPTVLTAGSSSSPLSSHLILPSSTPLSQTKPLPSPTSPSLQPPSPNPALRRISLTPGGTTKVLADLQTGVVNARNALENTKTQLRLSQRTVAQLTRQTEDLKEGRERLRLENEGLNNVVARKERLLQEVLERARKAEAEAATLKTQLKQDTATSKKTLREMETALNERTALSQKSEREYLTLRDSLRGLTDSWRTDVERLREEMRKKEETWRVDAEATEKKWRGILEEVRKEGGGVKEVLENVRKEREEEKSRAKEIEQMWKGEVDTMKCEVERSVREGDEVRDRAKVLEDELARLRRLMRGVRVGSLTDGSSQEGGDSSSSIPKPAPAPAPS